MAWTKSSTLLCLSSLIMHCSSGSDFKAGVQKGGAELNQVPNVQATSPAGESPAVASPVAAPEAAPAANPPAGPATIPTAAPAAVVENKPEEALSPEAVAPAVVAGAYLSCNRSVDPQLLACNLRDGEGNDQAIPVTAAMSWTYIDSRGTTLATTAQHHPSNDGSFFFVNLPVSNFQSAQLSLAANTLSPPMVYTFAAKDLPLEGENLIRTAVPVVTITGPGATFTGVVGGRVGDGIVSNEGDDCTELTDDATTARINFGAPMNQVPVTGNYDIVLDNVCGLQNSKGYFRFINDSKSVRVTLLPGVKVQRVTMSHPLVAGPLSMQYSTHTIDGGADGKDDWMIQTAFFYRR